MRARSAIPGIGAALAAALAAGCAHPAPAPSSSPSAVATAAPTATALPIRVVTNGGPAGKVTIVQTIRGRKVYTITADSSVAQRGPGGGAVAQLEHPHVVFRDKDGTTMTADAPKATVTEQDKTVLMTGGVRSRTSGGNVLTCDSLRYDARSERLLGVGHVVLTSPSGLQLTGNYLSGDVRLDDVKITMQAPAS